ncbi:MAG: lipoprotein [bacterium]
MRRVFLFITIILVLSGCGTGELNNTNTCKVCHTNAQMLKSSNPAINPSDFLVTQNFFNSPHGILQCADCHKGDPSSMSMQQAHTGMINDPSLDPNSVCVHCHAGIVQSYTTSLHYTLAGEKAYLNKVSCPYNNNLNVPYSADCQRCHASCGNCHVAKPLTGGLISGHTFMPVPPMEQTCLQCHKDQANEFLGLSSGIPDVHYTRGLQCIDCHGNGIHGDGITYTTMWDVKEMPQCGMCHTDVTNGTSNIEEHNIAQMKVLNCTVCHAQPYTNTYNYTGMFAGNQYVGTIGMTTTDFKIGFNTVPSQPYLYTTVRHYPITRYTFDYFGTDLLNDFDLVPTWQTTSPHNIQLVTPQNTGCNNYHTNTNLFLTRGLLNPDDSIANLNVVTQPPPAIK